ncbi:hypothetical protein NPIL_692081 [Nephila pilipes]|uniref:Uncharacterized protein n=1 Tax=Nephila pilipes TaxID=299642 RepID=A0A8X6P0R5_NEPPI|nr:hypothetical protein NPIL_692081 [Nephila pilipes]
MIWGVERLYIQCNPPGNQPRRAGIHAVMLSAYFAPWPGRLPIVAAGVKKGIDVALFDSQFNAVNVGGWSFDRHCQTVLEYDVTRGISRIGRVMYAMDQN